MQIFIQTLHGRTIAQQLQPGATPADLESQIEAAEGLPASELHLTYLSRPLDPFSTVAACGVRPGSTLHLALRLCGGKGGFGSNLRAAGKQKLTDNFDACRDLQGRRIRHKTAASKLEEWQAEAQERDLEKVAMKHLKEVAKEEKRQQQVEVDVTKVRSDAKATLAEVKRAVKEGAAVDGKRTAATAQQQQADGSGNGVQGSAKRRKVDALLLGDLSDSDTESGSEAEDDK